MKLTLPLILFLFITTISRAQTLPNGDFETWITDVDGFLDPDQWDCSNMDGNGAANVFQDVGQNGSGFSVKFTAIQPVGIPLPRGGNIEAFLKTFTGSTRPLSIKGFWKTSNVALGDYIYISVYMYNASMAIIASETKQTAFSATNMNWTAFDIPLNYTTSDAVTKYNIFISLNTFSAPSINSVGYVDDLDFDFGTGVGEIQPSLANLNVFNNGSENHLVFDNTKNSKIKASVLNLTGQEMMSISDETLAPGHQDLPFNTSALPAGIYTCVVTCDGSQKCLRFAVTN